MKHATFDEADRMASETTGARSPALKAVDGTSEVRVSYTRRGSIDELHSSYGLLAHGIVHAADGKVLSITYGDLAATQTDFTYDTRLRLSSVLTHRGPPSLWGTPAAGYTTPVPSESAQEVLEHSGFSYDAGDNPTELSDLRDPNAWPDGQKPGVADDVHTLYIFASLELRRTSYDAVEGEYLLDAVKERVYLTANGERLAQLRPDEPGLPAYTGEARIFFEFADHLGSANTVIDARTGELVEKRTYTAYGTVEADHRQDRWGQFREDYGFTTKEEDVEVGLVCFGKRFYNPRVGRWLNADPLAIHSPGEADLNLYAYVSGRVFTTTDPLELFGIGIGDWVEKTVRPSSGVGQWIVHTNAAPVAWAQKQESLDAVRNVAMATTIAATTIATGGVAGPAVASALGVTGLTGAVVAGGAGAAVSGATYRWMVTGANGGTSDKILRSATNPVSMAKDATFGAITGGAFYGAGVLGSQAAQKSPSFPTEAFGEGTLTVRPAAGGIAEGEAALSTEASGAALAEREAVVAAGGVPELPAFDGKTTHGVLVTAEGHSVPLQSGGGNPAYRGYAAASHVERKAALAIRESGSSGGTVYHNNTNGTCGYCNSQISTLLPEGAQLNVVPPANAVANNSRAVAVPKVYTGNSATPRTR